MRVGYLGRTEGRGEMLILFFHAVLAITEIRLSRAEAKRNGVLHRKDTH